MRKNMKIVKKAKWDKVQVTFVNGTTYVYPGEEFKQWSALSFDSLMRQWVMSMEQMLSKIIVKVELI